MEQQVKKGRVKNSTGYLLKAFANGYSESVSKQDQKIKEQDQKKIKQLVNTQQANEKEEQLKNDFRTWRNAKVDKLLKKLDAQTIEEYKNEFSENLLEDRNSLFAKMYQSKGFDYVVIQHERYKFLAQRLLA